MSSDSTESRTELGSSAKAVAIVITALTSSESEKFHPLSRNVSRTATEASAMGSAGMKFGTLGFEMVSNQNELVINYN